jgi:hypothetical protein
MVAVNIHSRCSRAYNYNLFPPGAYALVRPNKIGTLCIQINCNFICCGDCLAYKCEYTLNICDRFLRLCSLTDGRS